MTELNPIAPPAVWALVPVKPPSRAKTRLAGVLGPDERARLQVAMLEDVIRQLAAARSLAGIAIVSADDRIRTLALLRRCRVLAAEPPDGGLNGALAYGAEELRRTGADLIVVVPADVPALDPAEIDLAVRTAMTEHALVVVPDHKTSGTNALVFPVARMPEFRFGDGSFLRHATDAGAGQTRMLPLSSVAQDIDEPADLVALRRAFGAGAAPNTKRCLAGLDRMSTRRLAAARH
jgi:2-phospho-L-lactate guanylyltransferase